LIVKKILWSTKIGRGGAGTPVFPGIDEEYFFQYFSDKSKGYAIEIKKVRKYKTPLHLKERFQIQPPQSFAYIV
jgi:predicted transcriptional regulator